MTRIPYRFVPLPYSVVDEIMPRLKDTEWRILVVVLRQTLNAQSGSGKSGGATWLSHSQLCARTGRANEAVSGAVDALVKSHLLEVLNEKGIVLEDASERRRERGRCYYRIGFRLSERIYGKPKIIEDRNINIYSHFRKTELSSVQRDLIEEAKRKIQERFQT